MKNKIIILFGIIYIIITQLSCVNENQTKVSIKSNVDSLSTITRTNDTIFRIGYNNEFVVSTNIKYPDTITKGTILMLHGWNLPSMEWCERTTFCEHALKNGYTIIIPDFGKCNYNLEIYPETINDYKIYPTITWIMESYIPYIQQAFDLLNYNHSNYVAGISTGARGATLLAYHLSDLFKGAASLSGDFDITKLSNEYLYYSNFGQYKDFEERWKKECFAFDCKNYNTPTYIGHGQLDNMSPVSQSIEMSDSINKYNTGMPLIINFPSNASHDYDYWESETDNIINFFNNLPSTNMLHGI